MERHWREGGAYNYYRRENNYNGGGRRLERLEEGWNRVYNKRRENKANQGSTSFFITDLPNGCTSEYLWETFYHYGKISDAFVPRRKDWRGRTFGFIRFLGVDNVDSMLSTLREVKVDGTRIRIYVSRFGKEDSIRQPRKMKINEPGRWAGRGESENRERTEEKKKGIQETTVNRREQTDVKNGGRRIIKLPNKCAFFPSHCNGRTLVGEVAFMEVMEDLIDRLDEMEQSRVELSYIGGMKMLLTFKDRMSAENFLTEKKEQWSKKFSMLRWWDGREQETERLVKLKIMGVPLMARDGETFDKIAEAFGRRAMSSDSSWANEDVSSGCCYILTNKLGWIDEVVDVEWRNHRYEVWVTEEAQTWEIPSFSRKKKPGNPPGNYRSKEESGGECGAWEGPTKQVLTPSGSSNEEPINEGEKHEEAASILQSKGLGGVNNNEGGNDEEVSRVPNSFNIPVTRKRNDVGPQILVEEDSEKLGHIHDGGADMGQKKDKRNNGANNGEISPNKTKEAGENSGGTGNRATGLNEDNVTEKEVLLQKGTKTREDIIQDQLQKGSEDENIREQGEASSNLNWRVRDLNNNNQAEKVASSGEMDGEAKRGNTHDGVTYPDYSSGEDDDDEVTWEDGGITSLPTFRRAKKGIKWAKAANIRLQARMMRGGGKSAIWGQFSRSQSTSSSRTQSVEFGASICSGKNSEWIRKETRTTMEVGKMVGIDMDGFEKEVTNLIRDEGANIVPQ
ncbi:hypothetical protein SSX86_024641 [Deinandra increscens subsp. villosa]|uniref:RRM domain-containing protein n=1 Tax=Deinandra increscens subsp. villosa TaxID=3103831 RepID=A0AAP0CG98_9ASTR